MSGSPRRGSDRREPTPQIIFVTPVPTESLVPPTPQIIYVTPAPATPSVTPVATAPPSVRITPRPTGSSVPPSASPTPGATAEPSAKPVVAFTITSPAKGAKYTYSPISVSGTGQVGSTITSSRSSPTVVAPSGKWFAQVRLAWGSNKIVLKSDDGVSPPRTITATYVKPTPTPTPKPLFPRGFAPWYDDASIGWRWLKNSELTCSAYGDGCWGMYVIPLNGCSSLYVELTTKDSAGNVVGSALDGVGRVSPGGRAKLKFEAYGDAASAFPSKISCY